MRDGKNCTHFVKKCFLLTHKPRCQHVSNIVLQRWFQEMTFREFETACEQSSACSHMAGLQRTRCIRECVSPSCYRELYQTDPVGNIIVYETLKLV